MASLAMSSQACGWGSLYQTGLLLHVHTTTLHPPAPNRKLLQLETFQVHPQGGSNTTKNSSPANENPVYVVITEVWSFWQKIISHLVRVIHRWPRPRNTCSKKTGGKRADESVYAGWFQSAETNARVKEFTPPPSLTLWKRFRLSQEWGLAPITRQLRQEGGDSGSALGNTRPTKEETVFATLLFFLFAVLYAS